MAQAPVEAVKAILRLTVNDVDRGEVVALVRDRDVLVRIVDLERAGLRGLAGRREAVGGELYTSLASLSPTVRFELDEAALVLRLTALPSALETTIQDFQIGAPQGLLYSQDSSAFLNTSVSSLDFERLIWTGEGGLSVRNMLLYGTAFRDEEGDFSRGLTSFTLDDRARMVRWLVGDRFDSTGQLGGSAQIGGFSVSREFGLDPYFVRFPTVALSGAVLTRSTAEIYVNGQLLRREQLPPGPFELRNLPAPVGSGIAEVVLRDAFGRQQVIASPFYFTSTLLRTGVQEFSYDVGFKRVLETKGLGEYGGWAVLGRHRIGVTDDLSAGARAELGADLVSGGPVITARLPLGEMELSVAGSRGQQHTGWAASLGYTYASRPITLGANVTTLSDHYTNTTLKAPADRPRVEVTGLVGIPVTSRASVTLQHTYSDFRDRDVEQRSSASLSLRLTSRASLFVTALHSRPADAESSTDVFTGLTYFLGDNTTGTLSGQVGRDSNTTTVEVQRSLPLGTGYGYRVQASRFEQEVPASDPDGGRERSVEYNGLAQGQHQSRYGFYEASYQRSGGRHSSMLTAAAGIVAMGGGLHWSRPVQDGFALIDVPGLAGVRGYLNNQEIGRTDARGKLLVPNLLPYYGNRLGIADQDVPLEYSIGTTERLVAPPVRGGAVVSFPARRIQAFVGTVLMDVGGRAVTPAYGQLTVTAAGQAHESPIGRDGEFYLESLPIGRHPAVIEHKEGTCRFTLEATASPASLVELGTLRCPAAGLERPR